MDVKPLVPQIDIKIDNEALYKKITELQAQITTLESEKAQLQNQILTLEGDITELEAQIQTLESQISDLQTQISDLQSQVSNYESGLDAINGEVVQNKVNYALESKNLIAAAINEKGGTITSETTLRQYPNQIATLLPRKNIKTNVLLHFDNPDKMTEDSSFYSAYNVIYMNGTGELSTSIKKFGRSSYHFTGANNVFLQGGHGFPFTCGNDITIEFWYYRDVALTSSRECLVSNCSTYSGSTPTGWWLTINNSYISFSNSGAWTCQASSSSITLNTWHHVSFCRAGNKARIFVDGTMLVEYTISTSSYGYGLNWAQADFVFGSAFWSGNLYLKGYMDEIRVTNDALYKENFTPPTEPFTA